MTNPDTTKLVLETMAETRQLFPNWDKQSCGVKMALTMLIYTCGPEPVVKSGIMELIHKHSYNNAADVCISLLTEKAGKDRALAVSRMIRNSANQNTKKE
jgi:GH24 family phage-related lysozyme (muramidase)